MFGNRSTFSRLALIVVAPLLCWSAFPPVEFALGAWLAPLCWTLALTGLNGRSRFRVMFVIGFAVAAGGVCWLWNLFGLTTLFLWGIFACHFALWGVALGIPEVAGRSFRILAFVWPAMLWCAIEYFRGEVSPLCFSWLSLGYSQQGALGGLLSSCIGVYGVGFLIVLWATAASSLIARFPAGRRKRLLVIAFLATPLLSFVPVARWDGESIGAVRLRQFTEGADVPDCLPPAADLPTVDLEVWPEYTIMNDPLAPESRWLLDDVRARAKRTRWGLIFGATDPASEGSGPLRAFHDTAFWLNPSGELAGKAVKNQPIQLMRDGLPADDVTLFTVPSADVRLGVGVCYDGSFQRFPRRMAALGADALTFPTYNAALWGATQHRQHQRMYQTRAAETGLSVLSAAFSGPTFAARPNGAVGEELPFGSTDALDATIAAPREWTLFLMGGWLIGPICMWAALVVLLLGAWFGLRSSTVR